MCGCIPPEACEKICIFVILVSWPFQTSLSGGLEAQGSKTIQCNHNIPCHSKLATMKSSQNHQNYSKEIKSSPFSIFYSISLFIFIFSFSLSLFVSTLFMSESYLYSFFSHFFQNYNLLLSQLCLCLSVSVCLSFWMDCDLAGCVLPLKGVILSQTLGKWELKILLCVFVCECLVVCVFHLSNSFMILAKDVKLCEK